MSKKFDPNKPFQTVDGRPARLLEANYTSEYGTKLLVVLITNRLGREELRLADTDGRPIGTYDELVNIPEPIKVTRWLAVDPHNDLLSKHCSEDECQDSSCNRAGVVRLRLDLVFFPSGEFHYVNAFKI